MVRTKKVAHWAEPSVSLMFLPHCDIFCDLLMKRRTAKWNLFVLFNNRKFVSAIHIYTPQKRISLMVATRRFDASSTCPHTACCGQQPKGLQAFQALNNALKDSKLQKCAAHDKYSTFYEIIKGYGWAKDTQSQLERTPKISHPRWRLQSVEDKLPLFPVPHFPWQRNSA